MQVNHVKAELFLLVVNDSATTVTDDYTGVLQLTLFHTSKIRISLYMHLSLQGS